MNLNPRNQSVLKRLEKFAEHPAMPKLLQAATNCLSVAEKFAAQREQLERDGHLSEIGRRAKLTEATKAYARDLRDARAPIAEAAKQIENLRGTIKPVQIDRSDIVSALERAEVRAFIRGLRIPEQITALLKQNDPKILDAVLEMPAALSGVAPEHYAAAKAAREEQLHGPVLKQVSELQTVVDEADAAAQIARNDLVTASGLQQFDFDKIIGPIESRKQAPWLLQQGASVVRVRPEKRGTPELYLPATPDEISDGRFFKTEAEYLANHAA
jgi:hypothetical protein